MRPVVVIGQYFRRGKSLVGYRQSRDFSSLRTRDPLGNTNREERFAAHMRGHVLDIGVGTTGGIGLAALVFGYSARDREKMEQDWKQKQLLIDDIERRMEEKYKI